LSGDLSNHIGAFQTQCPKTAAEAPPGDSVPLLLAVAMTTEEVVTAADDMTTGVTGIVLVTMTEENTIAHATTTGGNSTALALMRGGMRGPDSMIALVCRHLKLQVYSP